MPTPDMITLIQNERIKLRATFFNNISVALTAAGILVPFFSVSSNDMKLIKDCVAWFKGDNLDPKDIMTDWAYVGLYIIGLTLCALLAYRARRRADNLLKELV